MGYVQPYPVRTSLDFEESSILEDAWNVGLSASRMKQTAHRQAISNELVV